MSKRRWTVLIVPHDSDSPKQYEVGERGVRLVAGVMGSATLLVITAAVMLFSPWATPGARRAARESVRLGEEVTRLNSALAELGDSMRVIGDRETEFRKLAGISPLDSAHDAANSGPSAEPAAGPVRASMGDRPRPFAQFFANREDRPDASALLRRAGELSSAFAEVSDSMGARIERLRNVPSIMPTQGWLTGNFSRARLHPILHETRPHEGIDVSAPAGSPIVAPAGGVVKKTGVESGYGNVVEIDHGNGIQTLYAHCSRILVRPGQRVDRGQTIAMVGNTGLAVGPHLHYEIIVDGKHVNPLRYVLPNSVP